MEPDTSVLTDAEKAQFVLGVYFRTQAAIEKYLGREGLPQWTEHVAAINASAARERVPDRAGLARDVLAGLSTMLDVYGSDKTETAESGAYRLDVRRCGIYDYRERAQREGVELTLARPCEFCVDLHYRTAAHLGVTVHNELGERGCRWVSYIPVGDVTTVGDVGDDVTAGGDVGGDIGGDVAAGGARP
jgi:AhpD family alkylhydroperoxidase